jgi:tetratricopeptide (TPR) repeat protein
MSGITPDTLRRIETGTVIPRYETLVYLSIALKKDLLLDLKNYRNSSPLFEFYTKLDQLILVYNKEKLDNLSQEFSDFITSSEKTTYLNTQIEEQFKLMIDGICQFENNELEFALTSFIQAIKLTNPLFKVESFTKFKYSYFETRILILIGLTFSHYTSYDLSNKILRHCLKNSNFSDQASPIEMKLVVKIYFNLAYNAHLEDLHEKAITFCDQGIDYCNSNNLSYGLSRLYFRKGIAEFMLKNDNYLNSLRLSVALLQATKQSKLAGAYTDLLLKQYKIKI